MYLLTHPDDADKWRAIFNKLFANRSLKREKGYVAADIQYNVNSAIKNMNDESSISTEENDILPYGLRIQWTKETNPEAFMRENEMVVRMDYHANQDRNLVVATMIYLSKGLLPHSRRYINENILRSLDLTVGKKIVKENPVSLDYFFREVLDKEPKNIVEYCSHLEEIDKAGLFTRILLREFRALGRKLYPREITNQRIPRETKKFVEFLKNIAIKSRDEDVPLDFAGTKIRVGVCLVAKPYLRQIEPHCKRINKYIRDKDIEEIYVFAAGKENVKLAKDVVKFYKKHGLIRRIKKQEYFHEDYRDSGLTFPGICYTLVKGVIPNSIKILVQTLKEKGGSLAAASLTTIIRKNKGFENWPNPEFKTVYACLENAQEMALIEVVDTGGDRTATLFDD